MIQQVVPVLSNRQLKPAYFRLEMRSQEIAVSFQAGQFIHIRAGGDTFLRRPFSIFRIAEDTIGVVYKIVGKGTSVLSKKRASDSLDIIGPLGNGFTIPEHSLTAILVGGGTGTPPLLALADSLPEAAPQADVHCLIGARNNNNLVGEEDFAQRRCHVMIATDDGSRGFHGLVTDLLNGFISEKEYDTAKPVRIYACGPPSMLRRVAEISLNNKIDCELSLETMMGCGFGACLGCACRARDGDGKETYMMVCKDGPVFNAKRLVF